MGQLNLPALPASNARHIAHNLAIKLEVHTFANLCCKFVHARHPPCQIYKEAEELKAFSDQCRLGFASEDNAQALYDALTSIPSDETSNGRPIPLAEVCTRCPAIRHSERRTESNDVPSTIFKTAGRVDHHSHCLLPVTAAVRLAADQGGASHVL